MQKLKGNIHLKLDGPSVPIARITENTIAKAKIIIIDTVTLILYLYSISIVLILTLR